MTTPERYQKLSTLAVKTFNMRTKQKLYFRYRTQLNLDAAKAAEHKVDALLEELNEAPKTVQFELHGEG